MKPGQKYDSDIPAGHPSQENRDWHSGDRKLRAAGFKIHARPNGKEPIWQLRHKLFTRSEAFAYLEQRNEERKCRAKSSAAAAKPATSSME